MSGEAGKRGVAVSGPGAGEEGSQLLAQIPTHCQGQVLPRQPPSPSPLLLRRWGGGGTPGPKG